MSLAGWVDDLGSAFSGAGVFAIPLRNGTGTKTRVFDAGLLELPVVTTAIGAEGIPLRSGVHAVIAESSVAFAQGLVDVLSSRVYAESLGTQLRTLVEERYLEDKAMERFRMLVTSLLGEPRPDVIVTDDVPVLEDR